MFLQMLLPIYLAAVTVDLEFNGSDYRVPLYMCGGGTIPLIITWLDHGMSMVLQQHHDYRLQLKSLTLVP